MYKNTFSCSVLLCNHGHLCKPQDTHLGGLLKTTHPWRMSPVETPQFHLLRKYNFISKAFLQRIPDARDWVRHSVPCPYQQLSVKKQDEITVMAGRIIKICLKHEVTTRSLKFLSGAFSPNTHSSQKHQTPNSNFRLRLAGRPFKSTYSLYLRYAQQKRPPGWLKHQPQTPFKARIGLYESLFQ